MFLKTVGKNITNLRNKRNMTIEELSKKTGIRKEYLKKIESGEAIRFKLSQMVKIANALNVKINALTIEF